MEVHVYTLVLVDPAGGDPVEAGHALLADVAAPEGADWWTVGGRAGHIPTDAGLSPDLAIPCSSFDALPEGLVGPAFADAAHGWRWGPLPYHGRIGPRRWRAWRRELEEAVAAAPPGAYVVVFDVHF